MKRFNNKEGQGYYDTTILPSGQTIRVEFEESWSNSKYHYNVYLVISNKRKQANQTTLITTGKDGLKGLLWAKKKIIEFEEFIKEEIKDIPIIIYCYWDCNRRRDVYKRGLKNLGYRYSNLFGYKTLSKTIIGR